MTDGYSLRYTVPSTVTNLSPTKALMVAAGPPEAVWVPDPRPVPEGLREDFKAPPFDATESASEQPQLTVSTARTEWVSIQEKIGSTKMEELLALFGGYPVEPDE